MMSPWNMSHTIDPHCIDHHTHNLRDCLHCVCYLLVGCELLTGICSMIEMFLPFLAVG